MGDVPMEKMQPTSKPDPRVFFRSKICMGMDGETTHLLRRTYRKPVDPNGRPQGKKAIRAAKRARVKAMKGARA